VKNGKNMGKIWEIIYNHNHIYIWYSYMVWEISNRFPIVSLFLLDHSI
jgi:hypothetical protein